MTFAVLTGDLVRSTDLAQKRLDVAMQSLADSAEAASDWHGSSLMFSRNRGDGWQVCLARPSLALRTALYMRAALRTGGKDLSTRISIAIGVGDPGPTGDLNSASGPVFVESGRALDAIQTPMMMSFAGGGALAAAVRLADHVSQGWTTAQARAIYPMLAPVSVARREVAEALGISRQAVDQALEAAAYPALSDALDLIEADA